MKELLGMKNGVIWNGVPSLSIYETSTMNTIYDTKTGFKFENLNFDEALRVWRWILRFEII